MKHILNRARGWGKRLLFGAAVLAAGKSSVAILEGQVAIGACRIEGFYCYYEYMCEGSGEPWYRCSCQGNYCRTTPYC